MTDRTLRHEPMLLTAVLAVPIVSFLLFFFTPSRQPVSCISKSKYPEMYFCIHRYSRQYIWSQSYQRPSNTYWGGEFQVRMWNKRWNTYDHIRDQERMIYTCGLIWQSRNTPSTCLGSFFGARSTTTTTRGYVVLVFILISHFWMGRPLHINISDIT